MSDQSGSEIMFGRIADYLSGNCTPEERAAIEAWAESHPGNREIFDQVKLVWSLPTRRPSPPGEVNLEALKAKVAAGIGAPNLQPSTSPARPFLTLPARRFMGYPTIAAALALIVALAGIKYVSMHPAGSDKSTDTRVYATAPGNRANIKLSDGTTVILNVASRLHVPSDFGKNGRSIMLDGEAQFVVTHDKERPFTINANGTIVRDLATTFIVRSYKGDAQTVIAVRDGRVAVQAPTLTKANSVTLDAGQVAKITVDGAPQVTSPSGMDTYFGWIDGNLTLRDVPLGQALVILNRWYGKEFRVADSTLLTSLVNTKLPGQFKAARIKDLADAIDANVEISGNVVTLVRK